MRMKLLPLLLVLAITVSAYSSVGFSSPVVVEEVEFPHVEASKSVTPSKVEKDANVHFTITLKGAGGELPTAVDVMLIIDRSGSMYGAKIKDAKAAANVFLEYMDEDDRAGLVTYSTKIYSVNLTYMTSENKEDLKDEIDDIRAQGATNIYDAVLKANQILESSTRSGAPLVEVLLTDGRHNFPTKLPDSEFEALAEESKNKGVTIYTIGLGEDVNQDRLKLIADITGGKYYFAATSADLEEIYREIATKLAFAGTDIVVTETLPTYLTYNRDASHTPEESSSPEGLTLKWEAGTLKVGEVWEVTYTARADEAVEVDDKKILCKVEYMTAEFASAIINLPPGFLYHSIAITSFSVAPTEVFEGELVNLTVKVENQGIVSDSFELRTDVNGTVIDSRNLDLDSGEDVSLLLKWNTSDVDPGRYIVTTKADPEDQIWESNKTDNTVTGEVEVKTSVGELWWLIVMLFLIATIALAGVAYGYRYYRARPAVVSRCPRCGGVLEYSRITKRCYCPRCRRYYDTKVHRKTPPPRPVGKHSSPARSYSPSVHGTNPPPKPVGKPSPPMGRLPPPPARRR